jgi:hypothetical protein
MNDLHLFYYISYNFTYIFSLCYHFLNVDEKLVINIKTTNRVKENVGGTEVINGAT